MSIMQPADEIRNDARAVTPIRLMLVDDSLVARTVIARLLGDRPEFSIVAQAKDADQALAQLAMHRVDIILLDLEMPGRHGLAALPDIIARSEGARVLIVSSAAEEGAAATVRALSLGAVDTLFKPEAGGLTSRFSEMLVDRLLRIGSADRLSDASCDTVAFGMSDTGPSRVECLAIGASTGGVNALMELFAALPAAFDAPILVTQHLPAMFMTYFASQLQDASGRPARVAQEGTTLQRGEILVAPGEGHLCLERRADTVRVRIDSAPAPSGCMPSVDPMFASLAAAFGPLGVGIVLSGMGRDGLIGAARIAKAGGHVIAQDARSSVIWGMPGAVAGAGLASAVLPPRHIAGWLLEHTRPNAWT